MSDDPMRRAVSSSTPPASGSGVKEDPRTVISKRAVPPPEVAPPIRHTVEELGKSLLGTRLGHFQLETFVGGGGMGAVFRAKDLKLDRVVAVKILSKDRTDDDTVRRFQNEAQSAARLDHPNIARVYYVGEDQGWNYIVFEYIEGLNIRDLVEQRGPLPIDEVLQYVLQVAEALDHASRRDVVHRDIKPSNVLVMPDGRAKLVDMGLARLHQVEATNADLTATGVTLGTFDYISPEQARDPRSADVRSDLYSLGCTMYYMLTGQPPFPGGTVLQKLLSHSSDPPPDVRTFRPDLGEETSLVLERLLAKQPAHRYQTPSELIGALLVLADELGIKSVGSTQELVVAPAPADGWRRQIPWAVPAALLLVIVVLLQFLWPAASEVGSERMRPRFQPVRRVADRGGRGEATTAAVGERDATKARVPGAAELPDGERPRTDDSVEGNDDPAITKGATREAADAVIGEAVPGASAGAAKNATPKPSGAKPSDDDEATNGASAAAGAAAGATAPAVSGPLKRLIVTRGAAEERLDGSARQVETLAEALELAQEEPTVDVIECRWDGEQVEEDVEFSLSGRRLTIRPTSGRKPILAFKPRTGETPRDRRMLRVTQGSLNWEGMNLLFVLPVEPYDDWALISLDRAGSLELNDCVVTVRNAGRNGLPVNRVACVEWSKALSPEMASAERTARPGPPPLLQLRNTIVRGQTTLVQATDGIPFRLNWNQGLFASTEHMIAARGASEQPAVTDGLQLELQNVTLALGDSLCRMQMDAEHRFPWTCVCRLTNCIVLRASSSATDAARPVVLVDQQFASAVEPIRKRPFIGGMGNYYPSDMILFRVEVAGAAQDSVEYSLLDRDRARDEKWYDEQPTLGMVMWSKLPSGLPVDAQTQRDYVLDATPQNPARAAGFDPTVLPAIEAASETTRERPTDPPQP